MIKFLLALTITTSVFAVQIDSFDIIRRGGGAMTATVSKASKDTVQVQLKKCNYGNLTESQKLESTFILSNENTSDALSILNDRVRLADKVPSLGLPRPTGTWQSMTINYNYLSFDGVTVINKTQKISTPIVIINGVVSDILYKIEKEAKEVNSELCN